jgi:membrane-bound lytic murein transglycosylase D
LTLAASRPTIRRRSSTPGPIRIRFELRLGKALLLLPVAALAACATTPGPPPEALARIDPTPLPRLQMLVLTPEPLHADAFGEHAAELEPLPVPAGDLWERIVRGYRIEPVESPLVEKWERWYSDRPDYVARMVDRSRRYLYHIVSEIDARGMPLDLALLPMVESAFNPNAMSVSRASGIWQFMPRTGTTYGLKQNWWFDSRRDVLAATSSALDYLQNLENEFGDWQLALAAYNWGEGNVRRAIARNQDRHRPTEFESLTGLPAEKRNYLPKLQAVKNIIADPGRFNLALVDVPDAPYFAVVKTTREMDVKRAAELAEMPVDEFLSLNPQHNRPVIAGADEYTLLLPIDKAELFAAKLQLIAQPLVSWQAYRFKAGDTLPEVAAKFGLSTETLRTINGIGERAQVPVGHPLLVPLQTASVDGAASLENVVFTTVPAGRTFYYTVRRGDTLSRVARRYDVTIADLRRWNRLPDSDLRAGQQLRITSDAPAVRSTRRSTRGKHPAKGKSARRESSRHRARAHSTARSRTTARTRTTDRKHSTARSHAAKSRSSVAKPGTRKVVKRRHRSRGTARRHSSHSTAPAHGGAAKPEGADDRGG